MTDKAILMGDYMDLKFMRGLKVARVMIDIPIEHGERFIQMFGTPNGSDPVKVAVARLDTAIAEQSSSDVSRSTESKSGPVTSPQVVPHSNQGSVKRERTRFSEMPCSQQAALKLQDQTFNEWIEGQNPVRFDVHYSKSGMTHWDAAEKCLKEVLGITSKRELDQSPEKSEAWKKLLTDFEVRAYAR